MKPTQERNAKRVVRMAILHLQNVESLMNDVFARDNEPAANDVISIAVNRRWVKRQRFTQRSYKRPCDTGESSRSGPQRCFLFIVKTAEDILDLAAKTERKCQKLTAHDHRSNEDS